MGETAARVRIAPARLAATWVALVALVAAVLAPAGPAAAAVACGLLVDGQRQVGTAEQLAAVGSDGVTGACGLDADYLVTQDIADLGAYIGSSDPLNERVDEGGWQLIGFACPHSLALVDYEVQPSSTRIDALVAAEPSATH